MNVDHACAPQTITSTPATASATQKSTPKTTASTVTTSPPSQKELDDAKTEPDNMREENFLLREPGTFNDKYRLREDGVPRLLEARDSRSGIGSGRSVLAGFARAV